jgi:uncharacterized protein with von Willebrand factor type A (vWA) domain
LLSCAVAQFLGPLVHDSHGRNVGAYGYNPEGVRIGQESSRNRAPVKVWDQREYRNLDDSVESAHAISTSL